MSSLARTLATALAVAILGAGLVGAPAEAASKPVFTSMSATAGPIAGGRTITIAGSHFTKASKVRFGSVYASSVTYSSSTKLTVVTPKHAAGPVDVRVKTSAGTSAVMSTGVFTYRYVPTITKVSPSSGDAKGGAQVTIDGKYYTRTTKVRFGSTYSTDVKKVSSTRLTAVVPAGSAGTVDVRVKSSGGTSVTSEAAEYTYVAPPTITSLSTTQGTGNGGTKVTIKGTAFTSDSVVHFDTTKATSVTVTSPTQLTVVTPKHALTRVPVKVTTPIGTSKITDATYFQFGSDAQLRLKVGSFNVRVGSGYHTSRGPYEKPWTTRVPVVVDQIKREGIDVMGVQEASASTKYTATDVPQFQDLANRLGSPYKLTDTDRYCYDSDKAGNCRTGASSSDRIIYNSARLTLLDSGTRKLDTRSAEDGSGRYVGWATFLDKRTDKKFFFVNTHLEPNKGSTHNGPKRAAQTKIILNEIAEENTDNLPEIFAGDLAASKFDAASPSNVAHTLLTDAGYVDPLINTYKYNGVETLVDSLVNTRYNSLNYFEKAPRAVPNYAIGSYVDYILVRGGVFEMTNWHTVMNLNDDGAFDGVIPSDHNLVVLTVGLP